MGFWCQNDVVSTSMRRNHVASTLIRRHFYVMCPLGIAFLEVLPFTLNGDLHFSNSSKFKPNLRKNLSSKKAMFGFTSIFFCHLLQRETTLVTLCCVIDDKILKKNGSISRNRTCSQMTKFFPLRVDPH